ncbi:hypothetical protein [Xenorhabdus miraniensis]|uniref:Glutamate-1-semialdehyde 2,1-aminomutase n=1 Tax=Xenorhabdus miraniensis TaxID=351674 RepID=A0A2D0JU74_9GAMM|nr:hypothetical protein [Xenorhabdus miraniensis]PHM49884.1 glutamate-1-semialdehyde 2,1-aminomutase [Xenorhabdus miraniensis]
MSKKIVTDTATSIGKGIFNDMEISLPNTLNQEPVDLVSSQKSQARNKEPMNALIKLILDNAKDFYKQCREVLPGGTHYNFGGSELHCDPVGWGNARTI